MPVIFHDDAVKPTLEQVPLTVVPPIEQRRVSALEVAHTSREIGLRCAEVEMKMVVEQGKGEDPPTATGCVSVEQSQPCLPVVVIENDVSPIHTAIGHVKKAVLNRETFGDGHSNSIYDRGSDVQNSKLAAERLFLHRAVCPPILNSVHLSPARPEADDSPKPERGRRRRWLHESRRMAARLRRRRGREKIRRNAGPTSQWA